MFSRLVNALTPRKAANVDTLKAEGDALLGAGDFPLAAERYRAAARLAPRNARILTNLAFAQRELGQLAEAEKNAREAIAIEPAIADAHYLLAALAAGSANAEQAERRYRAAVLADPRLEAAWLGLCALLRAQGRDAELRLAAEDGARALPDCAELQLHLGQLDYKERRFDAAVAHLRRALAILPGNTALQNNIGLALLAGGRTDDAIASFQCALAEHPDSSETLCNLGNAYDAANRKNLARNCYEQAAAMAPHAPRALFGLGNSLLDEKDYDAAARHYQEILSRDPHHFGSLFQLAYIRQQREQFDAAIGYLQRALAIDPDDHGARVSLGACLRQTKRYEEALHQLETVRQNDPNRADACDEIGIVHQEQGNFIEAERWHIMAIERAPDRVHAHSNLGMALQLQGRLAEAEACFRRAAALDPHFALAQVNLAVLLSWHQNNAEAIDWLGKAIAAAPELAIARKNRAMLRLLCGDFAPGWREYESRFEGRDGEPRMASTRPHWTGEAELSGKTILLYAEQGFGDSLQFVRYAEMVAALGATVWLRVPAALKRLCASCTGVTRVFANDEDLPPYDYLCPLLSLPLAFGTDLASIPRRVPYLHAAPDDVMHWQNKLGARRKPRIGLVWAGDPRKGESKLHSLLRMRSLHFDQIRPWLAIPGLAFHSLQVGADALSQLDANSAVADHHAELRDFADTAALIVNLDLVVSVDTSVAHLAGAMGKPVWLLNRYNTDWRWLLERDDNPWYPTMRLFRQPALGDWDSVIAAVKEALCALDLH